MNVKALKKQLMAAIAMVVVAAVALGSSTYAWFINNTKVTAESVNMTATTANTLLISPVSINNDAFSDDRSWGTTAKMEYTGLGAIKPVSTVFAATTGSNVDGLDFFTDSNWATETKRTVTPAVQGVGDGSYNASEFIATTANYYKGTFEIKASQAGRLYLDSDTAIKMMKKDQGAFVQDDDTSKDMIKSMRLALVVTGGDSGNTTTNGVYVYQWDGQNLASGSTYNTTLTSLNNNSAVNGVENGIASATNGETAAKVANFSATSTVKNLGSNGVKALVSVAAPSNTSTLATAGENGADLLYTFTKADETVRITAYIWMEGCDYDCNNTVVNNIQGHTVNCQLGFALAAPENS